MAGDVSIKTFAGRCISGYWRLGAWKKENTWLIERNDRKTKHADDGGNIIYFGMEYGISV